MRSSVLVLFVVIVVYISGNAHVIAQECPDYKKLASTLHIYDQKEYSLSTITFLQDSHGIKYVLKQIKNVDEVNSPRNAVCEILALEVGHAVKAPLNFACLIPAGESFIGKKFATPATLHTHAPGVRVDRGSVYNKLYIRQKRGQHLQGLSRRVIADMSRHRDLPAMVALDTFVGNADRGKRNYFYDEATDSFCGIDMAGSFYRDICGLSIEHIKSFLCEPKEHFSQRELQGLLVYYKTLQALVAFYKPDYLCVRLEHYIQQAGLQQEKDADFFNLCRATIVSNHAHAVYLVKLLAQLLVEWHMLPAID